MAESSVSKISDSFEISDLLENEKIFPHLIGFNKDIIYQSNNYFISSLHCLTNIRPLRMSIVKSPEIPPFTKLLEQIDAIQDKIQNKQNKSTQSIELEYDEMRKQIKVLAEDIIIGKHYDKNKKDPRDLIRFMIDDFRANELINEEISIKFNVFISKWTN